MQYGGEIEEIVFFAKLKFFLVKKNRFRGKLFMKLQCLTISTLSNFSTLKTLKKPQQLFKFNEFVKMCDR
jgi:hypothetical protein